jgi:hypothetical protein
MMPDPGSVKGGISHVSFDSGVPGQGGLLISLAVDVFEEVGIDLVGQPRVGADGQVRLEASPW